MSRRQLDRQAGAAVSRAARYSLDGPKCPVASEAFRQAADALAALQAATTGDLFERVILGDHAEAYRRAAELRDPAAPWRTQGGIRARGRVCRADEVAS